MAEVNRAGSTAAQPGDTVLLGQATSWDMFRDHAARGDAFARR